MEIRCQLAAICALAASAAGGLGHAGELGTDATRLASQEAGLRMSLAPTGATVVHGEHAVELHIPVRLAFVADRAELLPDAAAMLDAVAHSLREYKRTQVVVAVYTDTIGDSESNRQQAQARSEVVVAYLQIRGVAAERLIARGVGESDQLAAPNTPEGRDLNRRLEMTITALSS
jgi:outer membrane protein OmpA-like peptidoglycan-associated protein